MSRGRTASSSPGWRGCRSAVAAAILLRPSRAVALAAIVINVATIGVWVLTRTVGIAIGSDGTPEAWGRVDIVCATFEGLAIVATAMLLSKRFARRPVSARGRRGNGRVHRTCGHRS